jgi:hypothetical protein
MKLVEVSVIVMPGGEEKAVHDDDEFDQSAIGRFLAMMARPNSSRGMSPGKETLAKGFMKNELSDVKSTSTPS